MGEAVRGLGGCGCNSTWVILMYLTPDLFRGREQLAALALCVNQLTDSEDMNFEQNDDD